MTIRGTYDEYVSSPYWRRVVRPRILRRAAGRCELCHGDYNTEVHHLTYERLGHERDEDLMALCAGCHATVHEYWREPSSHLVKVMSEPSALSTITLLTIRRRFVRANGPIRARSSTSQAGPPPGSSTVPATGRAMATMSSHSAYEARSPRTATTSDRGASTSIDSSRSITMTPVIPTSRAVAARRRGRGAMT